MEIRYLDKTSIIGINRTVTKLSGDPHVVQNEGNLEYLTIAIKNRYEKQEDTDKIFLKAAFLLD